MTSPEWCVPNDLDTEPQEASEGEKSFDTFLSNHIGAFGKWQWWNTLLLMGPMLVPFVFFSTFSTLVPEHRCLLESDLHHPTNIINNQTSNSSSFSELLALCIPLKQSADEPPMIGQLWQPCLEYSHCNQLNNNTPIGPIKNITMATASIMTPCQRGMWYNVSARHYQSTLSQHFNWVCERDYIRPLENTLHMIGGTVSGLVTGLLADKYGRHSLLCVCGVVQLIGCLLITVVAPYHELIYMVLRFLTGFCATSCFNIGYVLLSELTTSHYRNTFSLISCLGSTMLSRLWLVAFSYWLVDWRWVNLSFALLCLPALLFPCWLSESPLWLLSSGEEQRRDKALYILQKAKQWNRPNQVQSSSTEPGGDFHFMQMHKISKLAEQRESQSLWQLFCALFSSAQLIRSTVISSLFKFQENLVYYGVSFYVVKMPGNPYAACLMSGVLSLPANAVEAFLYWKFARKWPLFFVTLLKAALLLSCFCIEFTQTTAERLGDSTFSISSIITLGALMCAEASITMTFTYFPELFPTHVRNHGFGVANFFGGIGSAVAPFIVQLDLTVWQPLPMLCFTSISVIAALLLPFLSETRTTKPSSSSSEMECEPM